MPKKSTKKVVRIQPDEYKPKQTYEISIEETKTKSLKMIKRVITEEDICDEIVDAFYTKYPIANEDIRNKFLKLLADLEANKELTSHLSSRKVTAIDLVEMPPEDRIEANMKQALEKMKKDELDRLRGIDIDAFPDSLDLKCKKCGSKKIYEYQRQTRSADEPMTRICTCLKCNFNWKQSC